MLAQVAFDRETVDDYRSLAILLLINVGQPPQMRNTTSCMKSTEF